MSLSRSSPVFELTFEQRAVWGTCSVCKVPHGTACDPDIGLRIGGRMNVGTNDGVVHLARLQSAPRTARIVGET